MSVKDVLVHLDGQSGSDARLEAALSLAETFNAHVSATCLVPEPFVPAIAGAHIPAEMLERQLKEAERSADALLTAARDQAGRRGVAIEVRRETGTLDRLPLMLARQARHADITLVGQANPDVDGVDDALLAEAAFMDSGRPALVIPYVGARALPPQRAVLAWDGSREAARAAADGLPLLKLAGMVSVLVVDAASRGRQLGAEPGADIARHLARHGVRVEVQQVRAEGIGIADAILSSVSDDGADLLVMGGYGHSRLREMILGGVTRQVLGQMTCPVLLSH